jgi:hypothetical protein
MQKPQDAHTSCCADTATATNGWCISRPNTPIVLQGPQELGCQTAPRNLWLWCITCQVKVKKKRCLTICKGCGNELEETVQVYCKDHPWTKLPIQWRSYNAILHQPATPNNFLTILAYTREWSTHFWMELHPLPPGRFPNQILRILRKCKSKLNCLEKPCCHFIDNS